MKKLYKSFLILLLTSSFIAFNGCGDDDDDNDSADPGSAPKISNLKIDNPEFNWEEVKNTQVTVNGSYDFEDEDGDLYEMDITLTLPNGQTETTPKVKLQGFTGSTSGPVVFMVALNAIIAGEWDVEVVAYDEAGNESNAISGKINFIEETEE